MLRRSGVSIVAAAFVALAPHLDAQKPPPPPATQKPPAKPPAKKAAPKAGAKPPAKPADAPKEPPAPPPPPPVVTMRTAYTSPDGQASETKLITNGTRQRIELGDGVSVITQCDTKQILQVNDKAKLYVAMPLDAAAPPPPEPAKRGGTVEYAAAFTQTGESKELFGLKATRVTTVVTKTPGPGACDKKKERIETDGWYAAMPVTLACAAPAAAPPPSAECRDERQESATGTPPAGAPLAYTITTYGEDGKAAGSVRMEVKDLVVAPVDAAAFDVPADYTKAADPASFVAAVERAANEARWGAPKAAGMIRIGVALPANKTKEEISTQALAEELVDQLSKAPYEAVPLEARTPAEQVEEAKHRGCDFIVALDLTTLKSSTPGKVGGMLRKATGGGSPSELHEAKVEYRLFTPGGPPPKAGKSASAKTGAFTWRRALGVAQLAARLYLGGPSSMMKLMLNQSGGGAGVGLPGGAADPSMNAVSLVFNLLGGGASGPADEGSRDTTIAAALNDASTDILKELRAKKGK
jgi:hypothetical protein